jgi:hypothetical protein
MAGLHPVIQQGKMRAWVSFHLEGMHRVPGVRQRLGGDLGLFQQFHGMRQARIVGEVEHVLDKAGTQLALPCDRQCREGFLKGLLVGYFCNELCLLSK